MAETSAIEWCDSTFNPWIGCTKVSPACDNCYAEALMDVRYGRVQWGPHGARSRTSADNWRLPRRWQRQAEAFAAEHGRRRRVFCASLADVFDNKAPSNARDDLWALIRECPDLDWLLLTKRPQNIAKMLPNFWAEIASRVWLGTSTESQEEADRRLPVLLAIEPRPAVFFASAEPLLTPIDFRRIAMPSIRYGTGIHYQDVLRAGSWSPRPFFRPSQPGEEQHHFTNHSNTERLDWVIVGGESGPNARPTHPAWVRTIRDQCLEAGTAFLFKQWGEWIDEQEATAMHMAPGPEMFDRYGKPKGDRWHPYDASDRNGGMMIRLGKKAAGRKLDGVTHDHFPFDRPAMPGAA